jgi:Cytochrome C oxidase, cbb3-type, subunit III
MGTWMDVRRLRRGLLPLACLLAAGLVVVLATGCGGAGGSSSTSASAPARRVVQIEHARRERWTYARERFREQCAGCHTLADAGARGLRYNLDHDGAISADRARYAIEHGEPGMPPWGSTLTRREMAELVAYVSHVGRRQHGESYWSWQAHLRIAGEHWRPEDGPYAPDGVERLRAGNGAEGEDPNRSAPVNGGTQAKG